MATLYKRATPSQARILRIVEGAVKNASDAHPLLQISPQHRRSIAKRAAGTLTAQWADVLAVRKALSETLRVEPGNGAQGQPSEAGKATGRGRQSNPSPLRLLRRQMTSQMWGLKERDPQRHSAFVEVLRMIAALQSPSLQPHKDA